MARKTGQTYDKKGLEQLMQRLDGVDEARRPPGGWGCWLVKLRVQKEGLSVQSVVVVVVFVVFVVLSSMLVDVIVSG